MQKLILLFVNRPYKPYSSDKIFYNALQLTNLVVGARRECKYEKVRGTPPYSYLKDTTNPMNYHMSKNELLAHCTFKNLEKYQDLRNQKNGKKILKKVVALRGVFVQQMVKKRGNVGTVNNQLLQPSLGVLKHGVDGIIPLLHFHIGLDANKKKPIYV